MKTKAFFHNIRQQLLEEISTATEQVIVAVAWFTDRKLFNLLLLKSKQGIDVQIMIIDDAINGEHGPDFDELMAFGGTVIKVNAPNPETLMHNKFCIIDKKTVITGSYNWSKKATTNHENITITWDVPLLAQQFLQEFEALKKRYANIAYNGKELFDYGKVLQRLLMIQSLINLNEFQELEIQLEKLQQFDLPAEVEEIITLLRSSYYTDALVAIEKFKARYKSVVSMDGERIARMRLQLIYLEIELASLQGQHDTLEKTISDFRYRVKVSLGDLILQLLDLKIEWNKIREKLGKAFGYEHLKEEFERFESEVNEAKGERKNSLSGEEEREIKELYKRGVQLCHPDKVQEPFKEKAQELFIRLKKAFDDDNYAEVSRIVTSLENGIWELGPELGAVKEVEKLEKLVEQLKLRVEELKVRLEELNSNEDYQELLKAGSLEQFLKEQEIAIKKDIVNYQDKIFKYKHEHPTSTN